MKKKRVLNNILILSISIVITVLYMIFREENFLFLANIIIMTLIILKSKSSYFSIKIILVNYVLLSAFFQYNTGKSYGILESSCIPLYYSLMNIFAYIYSLITYLFIVNTDILDSESEILNSDFYVSNKSIYFCCILAIITAIIAFPTLPFNKEYISNRFVALLPGNAWNHIAMAALLFMLPKLKKSNLVKTTYAFVIFWFVSHYERVDIIGLLVLCIIYAFARIKKKELKNYLKYGIIGIIIVVSMVYLGEARANNTDDITLSKVLRKVLVQNTAADVAYVYNSSIDYYMSNNLLLGKSYQEYLIETIPLLDSDIRIDKMLAENYNAPGGQFILSEPLMNFGILGIVVFAIMEMFIYYKILSKNNRYRFFLYCFLILTVFRTTWYGLVYIEKAIIYFIPIIYFITKFLDSIDLKNGKSNNIDEEDESVKVLFYCEKWNVGGIESFIMNIYRNLDRKKIKADILTSQNETNIYDKEIIDLGGEKRTTLDKKYNSPIIRTLKNFSQFDKEIKVKKYDIIHLNICHGVAMIYAYIAKKNGIKCVVLHSHNANIGNNQKKIKTIGHLICKHLFEKYADDYLACSDLAAKWLYTKKTLDSGKVKIINNAIDSEKFIFNEQEREKLRKELNINDRFVVGHIGRFGEQKNHNYLIDIFNEIKKIEQNSVLLLVGDGELKQEIVNKVNDLGLSQDVIFYGLAKDVPKVLWAMDAFVLPSLFEGKPIVGIETQAAALKTYMSNTITKTVKISEYVEYLDINDNPKKWAEEIIKNGKNYERRNMYDIILKNNYDVKSVTDEIENIYIRLINN